MASGGRFIMVNLRLKMSVKDAYSAHYMAGKISEYEGMSQGGPDWEPNIWEFEFSNEKTAQKFLNALRTKNINFEEIL